MASNLDEPAKPGLKILQAGEPVLRSPARKLSFDEIRSERIQELTVALPRWAEGGVTYEKCGGTDTRKRNQLKSML